MIGEEMTDQVKSDEDIIEEILENREAEIDAVKYETGAEEIMEKDSSSEGDEAEDEPDNRSREELYAATEAILFSMGDAVELVHLAQALSLSRDDTKELLSEMMEDYKKAEKCCQAEGTGKTSISAL